MTIDAPRYKVDGKLVTSTRKNHTERGLRGIHVGLPRHAPGWHVYVPSLQRVYNTLDVYFDEDFRSPLAFRHSRYPGHLDVIITEAKNTDTLEEAIEFTGSPLRYCNTRGTEDGTCQQVFAQPAAKEAKELLPSSDLSVRSNVTEFVIENILSHRLTSDHPPSYDLEVKWEGYDISEWHNLEHMFREAPETIIFCKTVDGKTSLALSCLILVYTISFSRRRQTHKMHKHRQRAQILTFHSSTTTSHHSLAQSKRSIVFQLP